jgi:hypothetical protein
LRSNNLRVFRFDLTATRCLGSGGVFELVFVSAKVS